MRKLFLFATMAGIAVVASWSPRAEAASTYYCEAVCWNNNSSSVWCVCSPGTDRYNRASNCADWETVGGRGCFLS
jgi:hypothetical protein